MWDISPAFREAIKSPVHTIAIKAEVLDTSFNVVEGGEFFDTGSSKELQNFIVDGSVDADSSRGARRAVTLSILNPNAEFSPTSDWGGLFYVDRLIRLWRGVRIGQFSEFVPIGTFAIDTADVVAERNMSIVAISGSDLWKKLTKGKLGAPLNYPNGTAVQDVIVDLATRAGVTSMVIDSLSDRTANTRNIQADLNFERSVVIGDEILKLATAWGLDVYFDPLGRMVSEDSRLNRSTVYEYAPDEDSSLLTIKASYTDDGLYNHVLVTGTADTENPIFANAFDTDPASPTNITKLGRRTLMYESTYIATQAQAQDTANKLLMDNLKKTEDIELQTICNPAFECNDVISVREGTFTNLDLRLRIRSFSVPLSSSRQSIKLQRSVVIS